MTSVQVVTVTPAMAIKWLERNHRNRTMNPANYEKLKRALIAGDWRLTTDAIGFNADGDLMNGQHRLRAIVDTGIPAQLLIARGLNSAAMDVIDTGRARKIDDVFKLRGETDVKLLSSVVRNVLLVDSGRIYRNVKHHGVTSVEALRLLDQEPGLREYTRYGRNMHRHIQCGPSSIAVAARLIDRAVGDAEERQVFFQKLATRADEPLTSPIHAVANRLDNARQKREDQPLKNVVYLFLTGWNKWVTGQTSQQLRFTPRGGAEFRLPEVVVP